MSPTLCDTTNHLTSSGGPNPELNLIKAHLYTNNSRYWVISGVSQVIISSTVLWLAWCTLLTVTLPVLHVQDISSYQNLFGKIFMIIIQYYLSFTSLIDASAGF